MTHTDFTLTPFDTQTAPPITIGGQIQRHQNQLHIQYQIQGDTDSIQWPRRSDQPRRCFALWEQTCLEFFIAQPHTKPYWEINLSPTGDWNIYQLSDYRQDLTESADYNSLAITTQNLSPGFFLSTDLDLTPIVPQTAPIVVAITAVIQDKQNICTYWATAHTAPEPDFHQRQSFIIQL